MPNYIKQLKIGNNNYNIKAEKAASQNSNAAVLRDIAYGTGSPSGGDNGAIYIQYNTTSTHPFLDLVYPVGAIYLSTVNTNPGTLFGGTWSQIKDRFLLAAGDTYSAGGTGGAATVTLNVDQIPSHDHILQIKSKGASWWSTAEMYGLFTAGHDRTSFNWAEGTASADSRISPTGGGQAHNNMPPYLTVYVWKRTA